VPRAELTRAGQSRLVPLPDPVEATPLGESIESFTAASLAHTTAWPAIGPA